MIKKLAFTTIFLFVALGAIFPHTIKAAAGPNPFNTIFNVVDENTNTALYNCSARTGNGIIPGIVQGGSTIVSGNDTDPTFKDQVFGICSFTGKASLLDVTQDELTAYFQKTGNSQGGVTGLLSNINAQLLDQRPASGIDYVNEKVYALSNFGTVNAATNPEPSTYYPGPGSELLRPIQAFWGWSVNLVFGFLVLLIIVIALAIMFRQRLGGAAEVTIQNAIPSIALAMILIPLSYAISGLFIDAITLGTNAVHGFLLGPQSPGASVYANRDNADKPNCDLQNTDVGSATDCDRGLYADDPTIDVWRARDRIDIRSQGTALAESVGTTVPSAQAIFNLISGIISFVRGTGATNGTYAWLGDIINFIIGILTIWIALKIFWKLINKYLTLIMMPAFSPFIFATAALPGNGTKSIVKYLKTMGAAALFYIVTYAMFILTLIFTDPAFQATLPDFRTSGYIPPLLGIQGILKTLTAGANALPLTQLIMTIVGLGIYFSIPKTLDSIDDALGTKFVLPQLIKTPFESMRESFNVALKGTQFVTRAAPNAIRTARTELNPDRIITRANRFRDTRLRGLRQGEVGTYDYAEGSVLAKEKARLQRELATAKVEAQKTGNYAKVNKLNRDIEEVDRQASRRDIRIAPGEGEKEPELKVSFNFKGGPIVNFSKTQYDEYLAIAKRDPLTPINIKGAKFVFEAIGFTLPSAIQLAEYGVSQRPATEGRAGEVLDKSKPFNTLITAGSYLNIPSRASFSTFDVQVDTKQQFAPADSAGTKFELGVDLVVKYPGGFFGGVLSPTADFLTDKFAFAIGDNETDPVRVTMSITT